MEELKVGYEIEVRDFDGRHKVLDIQGEKVKIQFGSCFTMDIKLDDITKIYAKKKPFSFSDQHLKRYYAFLDFNTTLDLHGKNVNDSLEILEEWLEYGRKLGHRHFKIIHGKGEGILRECVKRFLKRKKILEFSHESDFGGSTTLEL